MNQRRKKRILKKISEIYLNNNQTRIHYKHKRIQDRYGFISNPNTTPQNNFKKTIQNIATTQINKPSYSSSTITYRYTITQLQPKHLAVHNLCTMKQPPIGTESLLGLGLKFCVTSQSSPTDLKPLYAKTRILHKK
jgi:hypothetical protein